ncbi:MAG: hypothetical protein ABSG10_10510 [Terracidiphilus sp.]|jgi:hypothetical protein
MICKTTGMLLVRVFSGLRMKGAGEGVDSARLRLADVGLVGGDELEVYGGILTEERTYGEELLSR